MELDNYILLIYKDLKGEISPEEVTLLRQYQKDNPDAQKIYDEVSKTWEGTLISDLEVEADLTSLNKKIGKKEAPIYSLWPNVFRVAAILIVVLTTILFIYQRTFKNDIQFFANEDIELELPDGSTLQLMKGSTIVYKKTFEKKRLLELKGKAFFDVVSNPDNPFVIEASETFIEVVGTEFTVDDTKSKVVVSVSEGRVKFSNAQNELFLDQGEVGVSDQGMNLTKNEINTTNFNFWVTDQFRFENESLEEVFEQLSLIFDIEIKLEKVEMNACEVSAVINGEDADVILKGIAERLDLDIKVESLNTYMLLNGQCN